MNPNQAMGDVSSSKSVQPKLWGNSKLVTISCIARTLGLGNIWRFSDGLFCNGGGIFLGAYFLIVAILGFPLYYLELALGQFSSKINVEIFKALAPAASGIGWCQAFLAIYISSYYGAITSFIAFYFFKSFKTVLPWTVCKCEWGNNCMSFANKCKFITGDYCFSEELYFARDVLQTKPIKSLNKGIGLANYKMVLCGCFTWSMVTLVWKVGEKFPKVYYFLAFFPYVFLGILFAKACEFEGALKGIAYAFQLDLPKFIDARTWFETVLQVMFSLGLGTGIVSACSRNNKFRYHAKTISGIVVIVDTFTSLLFGMTNFAITGHLAFRRNVTLAEIPRYGVSSIFISYPQAFNSVQNFPNFFTGLFYLTIFVVSIGSLIGLQVVIIDHLQYCLPCLTSSYAAAISATICFLCSLFYFTPSGVYLIKISNEFGSHLVVCVLVMAILLTVNYCYGIQKICWDIEFMSQTIIRPCWRISWAVLDVILTFCTLVYVMCNIRNSVIVELPILYQVALWLIFCTLLSPLAGSIFFGFFENGEEGCMKSAKRMLSSLNWRPHKDADYANWIQLKIGCKEKMTRRDHNFLGRYWSSLWRMYD